MFAFSYTGITRIRFNGKTSSTMQRFLSAWFVQAPGSTQLV